jgi:cyclopropane-fatty-acyl-phospholipid synthase
MATGNTAAAAPPARLLPRLARRLVRARLERLAGGQLALREGECVADLGLPAPDGLRADLEVIDERFWRAVAAGGSLGAAEAYLAGWWESRDLTSLVRLMARNRELTGRLDAGWARGRRLAARAWHAARLNTRGGSRRNIEAHYDLGNELFALFLDDSLTYSAAFFARPDASLEEAQQAKLDRLCRKLQLGPEDHLLEIGTGWGSLAIHAAGRFGCRVTTTTLSPAQHAEAARRVAAAGLSDRVELLRQDYRDLAGRYSKIVAVEMIEAVGHRFLPTFFAALDRLLLRDGLVALQAITIADRNYEAARHGVDFIQRHVFPGGAIPSLTALLAAATRGSALTALHVEDLGLHYAETLRQWRERFEGAADRVRRLGYPERFVRLWRYYLAYSEGGFRERVIGDAQVLFAGPEFRGRTRCGTIE